MYLYLNSSKELLPNQYAKRYLAVQERAFEDIREHFSRYPGKRDTSFISRYLGNVHLKQGSVGDLDYLMDLGYDLRTLSKRYGLWDSYSVGIITNNVFFDADEIFMSVDPKIVLAKRSWRDMEPVQILYCQDLVDWLPANLLNKPQLESTVVYSVCLPELALMYSKWRSDMLSLETDTAPKVEKFIAQALYPSIVKSIINISTYSICVNYPIVEEFPDYNNPYLFSLPDPSNPGMMFVKQFLKNNNKSRRLYGDYLEQIPALGYRSFYDYITAPNLSISDSLKPLLYAINMYYVSTVQYMFPTASKVNTFTTSKMKLMRKQIEYSRGLKILESLPEDLQMSAALI